MTPRHATDDTLLRADQTAPPLYWVKAIRELGAVGALIAIAGYTVYCLVGTIPSRQDMTELKQTLSAHVLSTQADLLSVRALLRAICFNTAKTDNERAACQVTEK